MKMYGTGIWSLPDEIVYQILRQTESNCMDLTLYRHTLPLVCKRWREILYLQGGHHPLEI